MFRHKIDCNRVYCSESLSRTKKSVFSFRAFIIIFLKFSYFSDWLRLLTIFRHYDASALPIDRASATNRKTSLSSLLHSYKIVFFLSVETILYTTNLYKNVSFSWVISSTRPWWWDKTRPMQHAIVYLKNNK